MNHRTRRDFLVQLGGIAAASGLLPQAPAINAAPLGSLEPDSGSSPGTRPRLRGLMLDAARVPEPLPYYRRVIDFCAQWELNAVQFRLADDQGSALRFSSVPDLLAHKHAFAPEQLHELALYGRTRGVELIPELESFGHTGYITRSKPYAHLLDTDPQVPSEFTGIIPVHPETAELFTKLYREISSIFPSSFLHGGCDEVNWGGSLLSRKALETRQRHEIWAQYLNSLSHIAENLGKQFIVWGDIVLHKEPKVLDQLRKTIIVMDWNYTEKSSGKVREALSTLRSKGFRGIGAPALINYRWGARAGADQLANIDAFADAYLPDDAGSLGVILTNWVPSRYIQNSIWDGFAYAAVAFREGSSGARRSGLRRWVEHHYGANWNSGWEEAFRLIYDNAPKIEERGATAVSVPLRIPWSSDEQIVAALKHALPRNPFTRLNALLPQLESKVVKNRADFQAFALSVSYLQHLYWRESVLADLLMKKPLTRGDVALVIKNVAERDRTLNEELSKDWDRGRFSDSAAKSEPLFGFEPKDQLVFQFQRAADYSASLASNPDRLLQLLKTSKPA